MTPIYNYMHVSGHGGLLILFTACAVPEASPHTGPQRPFRHPATPSRPHRQTPQLDALAWAVGRYREVGMRQVGYMRGVRPRATEGSRVRAQSVRCQRKKVGQRRTRARSNTNEPYMITYRVGGCAPSAAVELESETASGGRGQGTAGRGQKLIEKRNEVGQWP